MQDIVNNLSKEGTASDCHQLAWAPCTRIKAQSKKSATAVAQLVGRAQVIA